jgi:predicted DNA-binding ribbon-helix-helix protein
MSTWRHLQSRDRRPVRINGHVTSICVEQPIWDRFKIIAACHGVTIGNLLAAIDCTMRLETRLHGKHLVRSLSSAVRMFVVEHSELKIKRR